MINTSDNIFYYTYTHEGTCQSVGVKVNNADQFLFANFALYASFDHQPEGLADSSVISVLHSFLIF